LQHVHNTKLADVQAVSFDLEEKTRRLELIAEWRDELRRKLGHALNDVWSMPDLDELRSEVEHFKLACKGARA
jgi:hypothetical protein